MRTATLQKLVAIHDGIADPTNECSVLIHALLEALQVADRRITALEEQLQAAEDVLGDEPTVDLLPLARRALGFPRTETKVGRPFTLTPEQLVEMYRNYTEHGITIVGQAKRLGISEMTATRAMRRMRDEVRKAERPPT